MDEEKWNKTRTSGKYRYVMNEGLRWGLISGSLWAILSYFIGTSSSFFTTLVVGIVVFSLAGCLWALVSWLINERKYHRGRSLE
ncbi:hypothetical protein [Vibrio viridaestus]|uniref:Uncharacterized protein n=1 Tax=Vibrio viridaestus TaxID=2487322 RepID=A0A3N9TEE2_9VIBR|nr:hypothetical protein [Vibrio viridaestus]RQW62234.1 hypothetical protein EES38_16095 [Vibrio viridaestus]